MNNQAAQTMPSLPEPSRPWDGVEIWSVEQIHQYARDYAAMLAAAPAASGVHPDALPDGTLSKSTAKRVEVLAAASVSERARALMAKAYRDGGFPHAAGTLEAGVIDSVDSCALSALEQALTQQRGEAAAHASGVPGRITDSLVSIVEAAMHDCYMDHDDYRITTALLHDMAVAAVEVASTTPQPGAEALRELVQRWRKELDRSSVSNDDYNHGFDVAKSTCCHELESLLGRGAE